MNALASTADLGMDGLSRFFTQRALAWYGAVLLVAVPFGLVWTMADPRLVGSEPAGLKPTRFALSIAVYFLTMSWMFGLVRPDRLTSGPARAATWMMLVGSTVEMLCIVVQALRARRSHFNLSTPGDAHIYAVMGVFAVLFIGAVLPLAWEIAQRPRPGADPVLVWAVVLGLLATFLLGGGAGAMMSAHGSHTFGREGPRVPWLGWSLGAGDMRVAHFFGIHAMQAFPLMALAALRLCPSYSRPVVVAGGLAYVALILGVGLRAAGGEAVVPLLGLG